MARRLKTDVFARLACRRVTECPFGQEIDELREQVYVLFEKAGEEPRKKESHCPSHLSSGGLAEIAEGVRVGVGFRLPRGPAVYSRKRKKARESGGTTPGEPTTRTTPLQPNWQRRWRHRGAQVKSGSKEAGDLTIMLLFDGTHGVPVNKGIRARDQDKSPAAQDIKRFLHELADHSGPKFGFKVDVKDAHRLVPVSPQDCHLRACRSEKTKQVFVNMTGTFGVASAAYWWSRVATAAVRGARYVFGRGPASWLLLVADDLAVLIPHGKIREAVLLLLVYLRVMGFPLSWKKLGSGESFQWVGYEMILKSSALSPSASRAQWLEGWYTRLL